MAFKAAAKGMGTGLVMTILAVVILGGIVLGGWAAGWWFKEQNTQRQDQVYDQSYGRQQALKDNITKNIALVNEITVQIAQSPDAADVLSAQRKSVVGMVCADAVKISKSNPLDPEQGKFVDDNCEAGAISPTSIYFK